MKFESENISSHFSFVKKKKLQISEPILSANEVLLQWNPREVNTLEVNSRLKSTPHGGPDFFLLCISNFISLKVNDIGPILG